MKKLISGLLIFCASAIFASDIQFLALMEWAGELNVKAEAWNRDRTGDSQVLNQQFAYFVECANRYVETGTDCRATLRLLAVRHEIRLFRWNLNCAGVVSQGCKEESDAVDNEMERLREAAKECIGQKL